MSKNDENDKEAPKDSPKGNLKQFKKFLKGVVGTKKETKLTAKQKQHLAENEFLMTLVPNLSKATECVGVLIELLKQVKKVNFNEGILESTETQKAYLYWLLTPASYDPMFQMDIKEIRDGVVAPEEKDSKEGSEKEEPSGLNVESVKSKNFRLSVAKKLCDHWKTNPPSLVPRESIDGVEVEERDYYACTLVVVESIAVCSAVYRQCVNMRSLKSIPASLTSRYFYKDLKSAEYVDTVLQKGLSGAIAYIDLLRRLADKYELLPFDTELTAAKRPGTHLVRALLSYATIEEALAVVQSILESVHDYLLYGLKILPKIIEKHNSEEKCIFNNFVLTDFFNGLQSGQ